MSDVFGRTTMLPDLTFVCLPPLATRSPTNSRSLRTNTVPIVFRSVQKQTSRSLRAKVRDSEDAFGIKDSTMPFERGDSGNSNADGPDLNSWREGHAYVKKFKSGNDKESRGGNYDSKQSSNARSMRTRNFPSALVDNASSKLPMAKPEDEESDFSESDTSITFSPFITQDEQRQDLSILYREQKYAEALEYFEKLRRTHIHDTDVSAYNVAIACHIQLGQIEKAEKLKEDMTFLNIKPSPITFITILQAKSKYMIANSIVGSVTSLFDILDEMKMFNIPATPQTFNIMLNTAFRCGTMKDVAEVLAEMRAANVKPDDVTLSTFISCLRRLGRVEEAFKIMEVFKSFGVKPNVLAYSGLIEMCVQTARIEMAMELYEEMKIEGITPDPTVFKRLFKVCSAAQSYYQLERLLEQMKSYGLSPTEEFYAMIISAYGQEYNLKKAFDIFRQMQYDGVRPTSQSLGPLFQACAKSGATDIAFRLLDELEAMGIHPDDNIYLSIIEACGRRKDLDRAIMVLEMMRKQGREAKTKTYNSMINAAGASQQLDKAFKFYENMLKSKVKPDVYTYNVLMSACRANQEYERCFTVFKELEASSIEPDVCTFNTLISACGQMNNMSRALELMEEMQRRKIKPTRVTYNSLLTACNMASDTDLAKMIFTEQLSRNGGPGPDAVSFNVMLDALSKDEKYEKEFFEYMEEADSRRLDIRFGMILLNLARRGQYSTLTKLIQREQRVRFKVDTGKFQTAVDTLIKKGATENARQLVEWGKLNGAYIKGATSKALGGGDNRNQAPKSAGSGGGGRGNRSWSGQQ